MPALLLLLALTAVTPEQAARKHFEHAEKLYALGKFQDALVEYEGAIPRAMSSSRVPG